MNNLDNIGVDELDYDIQNHMKFSWFDTDTYEFNKDDNNGYVFGIVSWYGQYDLDTVADWYNSDGSSLYANAINDSITKSIGYLMISVDTDQDHGMGEVVVQNPEPFDVYVDPK